MKILVLSNMYPSSEHSSFGIFVHRMNLGLEEHGAVVDKVVMTRKKSKLNRLFSYLVFFVKASLRIIFVKYDILYFHYPTYTLFPYKLWGGLSSAKVVMNFHGTDLMSQTRKSKFLKSLFKNQFEDSDLIVSPSHYFIDEIKKVYHIKEYFVSASGGVEDLFFHSNRLAPRVTNAKNVVFGFLSRVNESKGWKVAFDAFESLCDELPEEKVPVLIFAGPVVDVSCFYERLGSTKYDVKYVGELDSFEVVDFFKEVDCLIFPSLLPESLGLVALEAFASSVPVIASRIGAIPEYVNSQNGMLFSPGSSPELRDCMKFFSELEVIELTKKKQHCILTAEKYRSTVVSKNLYVRLDNLISR